jgi:hypothetical protein
MRFAAGRGARRPAGKVIQLGTFGAAADEQNEQELSFRATS